MCQAWAGPFPRASLQNVFFLLEVVRRSSLELDGWFSSGCGGAGSL